MAKRTAQERLAELEQREQELAQKKAQLTARKKQIEQQIKTKERRERTHRLVTVGAIFEHHWGYMSQERAEKLAWSLRETVEALEAAQAKENESTLPDNTNR